MDSGNLRDPESIFKMAGETVVKDVVGVYSRLFDHRAVLQNESKLFVREFEGKRNDREVTRLAEAKHKVDQINENLPHCVELSQELKEVQEQLKKARQLCHNILVREEQEETTSKKQEVVLEKIQKEWQDFQKEVEETENEIKRRYQEKVHQLKEDYGVKDMSTTDSTQ